MTHQAQSHLLPSLQRSAGAAFLPIQREFNRLFDELGDSWANLTRLEISPRLELKETKTGIQLTAELPGMSQDDVKISIDDHILTISGEKQAETEKDEGGYRVSERSYGAFSRSIALPRGVDADKITATMSDGVLKLVGPKLAGAETKTIKIQTKK